ncbi:MAG: hypothetical protein ACPGVG_16685 [Mycobacterium sp.]
MGASHERQLYGLAAVVAGGGLLAAGMIFFTGTSTPRMAEGVVSGEGSPNAAVAGRKSTCAGWSDVKMSFGSMTSMPDGWDRMTYDITNVDGMIHARAHQLKTTLDLFSKKIKSEPAEVAAAAHAFVDVQSTEGPKLTAHTFSAADQAKIDSAIQELDRACGMQ